MATKLDSPRYIDSGQAARGMLEEVNARRTREQTGAVE